MFLLSTTSLPTRLRSGPFHNITEQEEQEEQEEQKAKVCQFEFDIEIGTANVNKSNLPPEKNPASKHRVS